MDSVAVAPRWTANRQIRHSGSPVHINSACQYSTYLPTHHLHTRPNTSELERQYVHPPSRDCLKHEINGSLYTKHLKLPRDRWRAAVAGVGRDGQRCDVNNATSANATAATANFISDATTPGSSSLVGAACSKAVSARFRCCPLTCPLARKCLTRAPPEP